MMIKKENLAVWTAIILFLALLNVQIFLWPKSFAAGISNIAFTLNNSNPSATSSVSASFNISTIIPSGGKVEIELPNNFSGLNLTSSTGSNLGASPVFSTGGTATTIRITVGTGGSSTGSAVTASGFTVTNPAEEGFYLIQIRTYNADNSLLDTGYKLVKIGNPIDIKSQVEESLVASIDAGTKYFLPDPAINNGRVTDQTTTVTIQTNAETEYILKGELAGNKLTASGSQIFSSDASDDYFRIGGVELNLESGTGVKATDNTVFTGATTIFRKTSGIATNGDLISTNYDLNISYYKEPAHYTGSLVYTVYPSF